MESSKEKIEAQLCAYVDGELDDAQRSEIEQHLAANPQHKALIAELRAASGLLRDLPRVASPIELNESLCGQLERSALLNPEDDYASPSRSVSRWPQLTAVAAVLLLATGLGLVVYYVLPPAANHTPAPLAMDDKRAGQSTFNGDIARGRGSTTQEYFSEQTSTAPANGPELAKQNPSDHDTLFQRGYSLSDAHPKPLDAGLNRDGKEVVTAAEVESVRRLMNEKLGVDNNTLNLASGSSLYLLVSTSNASAANQQLAAYFKGNGIQYMAEDASTIRQGIPPAGGSDKPLAIAENEKKFGANNGEIDGGGVSAGGVRGSTAMRHDATRSEAKTVNQQITLNKLKDVASSDVDRDETKDTLGGGFITQNRALTQAGQGGRARATMPSVALSAPKPSGTPVAGTGVDAVVSGRESGNTALAEGMEKALKSESPVAADRLSRSGSATAPVLRERVLEDDRLGAQPNTYDFQFGDSARRANRYARGDAGNRVIIARMNRRQANELSAALSREQGQHVELKEFAPAASAPIVASPSPQKPTELSAAIDPATLTLGKTPALAAKTDAAPEARQSSADGAAGPGQKAGEIRDENAKLPGNLTKETASVAVENRGLGTAAGAAPTRAPAAFEANGFRLKTDPLDEPVDVYIVVKDEAAATPAPAPAEPKSETDSTK